MERLQGEGEQEWGQAELKHTSITSLSPNATFRWDNEMSGKKVVEFAVFDILQKMIGFIWMRTRRAHDRGAMGKGELKGVAGCGKPNRTTEALAMAWWGASRNQILMSQSSFIANQPEINHSCKRAANRCSSHFDTQLQQGVMPVGGRRVGEVDVKFLAC